MPRVCRTPRLNCWTLRHHRRRCVGALLPLFCAAFLVSAAAEDRIVVGSFSAETPGSHLPFGWLALTFKHIPRHTRYQLVKSAEGTVLEATADGSASGLSKGVTIDPKAFPIVRWRWKVGNLIEKGNPTTKSGDDYPARLYITFQRERGRTNAVDRAAAAMGRLLYGVELPYAAINYIWERHVQKETILPNAYTDRVRMIVVESGPERIGQWVSEERNVLEDYKRAFGEEPPLISEIAIMTDSDNTGESVQAWYGDISFHRTKR